MIDWTLIRKIIFPANLKFPDSREALYEELFPGGLPLGVFIAGMQGMGKTSALSGHLFDYSEKYPDRPVIIADPKGSNADEYLAIVARKPDWEERLEKIIYVDLGNPEWVVPMPEFSHMYGTTFDEQAHRVAQNLQDLAPELVQGAPYIAGLGLKQIAPHLFRLESAISDEQGRTWQVTETRELLTNIPLLRKMVAMHGNKVPRTKTFFEREFFPLSKTERELRTYSIRALLDPTEAPEIRAMLGYSTPGITFRRAIKDGLTVIIDGSRETNRPPVQHYHFTQLFSLVMEEINKRRPHDPNDKPFSLVLDEVKALFKVLGLAAKIAELAPQYRSRKLQLYIVLQELEQMSKELRPHIWSLGNVVCFAMSNFNEAYEIAQQLFPYNPTELKIGAKSETGQPIVEPDRGQYLKIANEIQRMAHRECIIRRYESEKVRDRYVRWVRRTKEVPQGKSYISVEELKERLLKRHGISVQRALAEIDARTATRVETKQNIVAPSLNN